MPNFKDLKDLKAKEGVSFSENISIENGIDEMTFEVTSDHEWLSVTKKDNRTIILDGAPEEGDAGEQEVVLSLTAFNTVLSDTFTISVKENVKPKFTSAPKKTGLSSEEFTFEITLEDDDIENDLTITAGTLPNWLTFEDNEDGSATLNGTPEHRDTGTYRINLEGSDGVIKSKVKQEFVLTINKGTGILDSVTLIEQDIIALPTIIQSGSATDIALSCDTGESVTLYIFDYLNNPIKKEEQTPIADAPHEGLTHCGTWNGTNSKGFSVAPGRYSAIVKVTKQNGTDKWYRTYICVKK